MRENPEGATNKRPLIVRIAVEKNGTLLSQTFAPIGAEPSREEKEALTQTLRLVPHYALASLAGCCIAVIAERETAVIEAQEPELKASADTVHAEVERTGH